MSRANSESFCRTRSLVSECVNVYDAGVAIGRRAGGQASSTYKWKISNLLLWLIKLTTFRHTFRLWCLPLDYKNVESFWKEMNHDYIRQWYLNLLTFLQFLIAQMWRGIRVYIDKEETGSERERERVWVKPKSLWINRVRLRRVRREKKPELTIACMAIMTENIKCK